MAEELNKYGNRHIPLVEITAVGIDACSRKQYR
jgi:hypothetical protein